MVLLGPILLTRLKWVSRGEPRHRSTGSAASQLVKLPYSYLFSFSFFPILFFPCLMASICFLSFFFYVCFSFPFFRPALLFYFAFPLPRFIAPLSCCFLSPCIPSSHSDATVLPQDTRVAIRQHNESMSQHRCLDQRWLLTKCIIPTDLPPLS